MLVHLKPFPLKMAWVRGRGWSLHSGLRLAARGTEQGPYGHRKVPVVLFPPVRGLRTGGGSQATSSRGPTNHPSSHEIRNSFIKFFRQRDHTPVASSSIIPKKGEGTYFVNAGMNQFKPLFLGTVDPRSKMATYRRAVNSQRCVRVGGKHNDLDDVGRDTYHHTFFEMLGSWSFGDYFKREACTLAWELLTEVYAIPPQNLYVTYFGGDEQHDLPPDLECRDIWLDIGVNNKRVLPCGPKENFWDMGETGPCGPCTEIHYAYNGSGRMAALVNQDSPSVIEIWNLVFMQFDRQEDGSLIPLPRKHVDTGMGLERLCAVMQGMKSNYDTDLFTPLFKAIHQMCSCPPYQGHVGPADTRGVDTAYRIVADHIRMITMALADGLRPGAKDQGNKLRQIMHRSLKKSREVLRAPPAFLSTLVPIVIDSLGDAFPQTATGSREIMDIIDHTEILYIHSLRSAEKMLQKALNKFGTTSQLDGNQILALHEGRFGSGIPVDMLTEIAADQNISLDMKAFNQRLADQKVRRAALSDQQAVQYMTLNLQTLTWLRANQIPETDDSFKYNFSLTDNMYSFQPLEGRVVALLHGGEFVHQVEPGEQCGVLVDRTCFYAEGGGQAADRGFITSIDDESEVCVQDVQATSQYVLHVGELTKGQVKVGDKVSLGIDKTRRLQCMCNHTATHLLNFALEHVVGKVQQQGSRVSHDKFTFDFSCSKVALETDHLTEVSNIVNRFIDGHLAVRTEVVDLDTAMEIPGLRTVQDEVYPEKVRVVSIGAPLEQLQLGGNSSQHSVELCGGTHVDNTADLEAMVITQVRGMTQGTRRMTAVTGPAALQAIEDVQALRRQLGELLQAIPNGLDKEDLLDKAQAIEKGMQESHVLPKVDRAHLLHSLDLIKHQSLNSAKNLSTKDKYAQSIEMMLSLNADQHVIVAEFPFKQTRDVISVLLHINPKVPVMLLTESDKSKSDGLGVCFVPKSCHQDFTALGWARHVALLMKGNYHPPGGKLGSKAPHAHILKLSLHEQSLSQAIDLATTYANLYVT